MPAATRRAALLQPREEFRQQQEEPDAAGGRRVAGGEGGTALSRKGIPWGERAASGQKVLEPGASGDRLQALHEGELPHKIEGAE